MPDLYENTATLIRKYLPEFDSLDEPARIFLVILVDTEIALAITKKFIKEMDKKQPCPPKM